MQRTHTARFFSRQFSSIPIKTPRKNYDVVISGGGLVGISAACAIALDPLLRALRVLVIEPRQPKIWNKVPERFSNRVFSVAPGTRTFFEELSVWDSVKALRFRPVRALQVWESGSDAVISFQQPDAEGNVSYVVEDEVLGSALWKRVGELSKQVDIIHGVTAKSYSLPSRKSYLGHKESEVEDDSDASVNSNLAVINLSDGTSVEANLLIGADGPNSLVRTAMGVQYLSWNYKQKGIVATLHLSETQDNSTGWQRFTSLGPIAVLPLDETRSSLVWSTDDAEAVRLMSLSDEEFLDALNRALWEDKDKNLLAEKALILLDRAAGFLGTRGRNYSQIPPTITGIDQGSRAVFPLGLGHATRYVIPRVALIGDAAHRIHPLAGLGVNLGFGDVMALRESLRLAISCGADIGSLSHLVHYETQAQRSVVPVMASVDTLHRLYSTQWTPAVVLRSLGVNLINSCDPLKSQIIKRASL